MSVQYGAGMAAQPPSLRAFLNGTTTRSYGEYMVWSTTTLYDDAGNSTNTFRFMTDALVATQFANIWFPAGAVWGVATNSAFAAGQVANAQVGFLVDYGLHPGVAVWGSATLGDTMIPDYAHYGALVASNTTSNSVPWAGRCLQTAALTVTQNIMVWVTGM